MVNNVTLYGLYGLYGKQLLLQLCKGAKGTVKLRVRPATFLVNNKLRRT